MGSQQDKEQATRLKAAMREAAPTATSAHDEAILANAARIAEQRRTRRRWMAPSFGLAATALLAVGLWQTQFRTTDDSDYVQRSNQSTAIVPLDGATVSSVPSEFRWDNVPGASVYRVTLFDDSATQLWQSEWISSEVFSPDAEQSSQLEPGKRYFWLVETQGENAVPRFGPYWFSIL